MQSRTQFRQIFDGRRPFYDIPRDNLIMSQVLSGRRPGRPMYAGAVGLSRQLWEYIITSWHADPTRRPRLSEIRICLSATDILLPFFAWPPETGSFNGMSTAKYLFIVHMVT